MSLEVIEIMIKESLRDGEISASEKETIVKQGESFGISKETVISMINAEVEKLNIKITQESKQKQEEEAKKAIESKKRENEKKKIESNKNGEILRSKFNGSDWSEGIFYDQAETWIPWSMSIAAVLGIVNAVTHHKAWYAYIGMFLLFAVYGFVFYAITYLISMITKRVPFLDWHKPVLIAFGVLVLAIICYLVIPF